MGDKNSTADRVSFASPSTSDMGGLGHLQGPHVHLYWTEPPKPNPVSTCERVFAMSHHQVHEVDLAKQISDP